jgi:hypothetical protein
MFIDETTFHMNGHVNRHSCRIWGQEQRREIYEYVCDSLKANVWCGLMHNCVIVPSFFVEHSYRRKHLPGYITNGCLPTNWWHWIRKRCNSLSTRRCAAHFSHEIWIALKVRFPNQWSGRGVLTLWPPRSQDFSPVGFFYVELKIISFTRRKSEIYVISERELTQM